MSAVGSDTRPARKHRLGNARIIEAMTNAVSIEVVGDATVFVGSDDRGIEMEIVAVPDDRHPGGIAVIHAMPTALRRNR